MGTDTEMHNWTMYRKYVRDFGTINPKWDVFIKLCPGEGGSGSYIVEMTE